MKKQDNLNNTNKTDVEIIVVEEGKESSTYIIDGYTVIIEYGTESLVDIMKNIIRLKCSL